MEEKNNKPNIDFKYCPCGTPNPLYAKACRGAGCHKKFEVNAGSGSIV